MWSEHGANLFKDIDQHDAVGMLRRLMDAFTHLRITHRHLGRPSAPTISNHLQDKDSLKTQQIRDNKTTN